MGVWAEEAYIPDVFSIRLLNAPRISRRWLERFTRDVAVLRELLPLVRAGVLKFANATFVVCAHCRREATEDSAEILVREFASEFEFIHSHPSGWLKVRSVPILGESTIEYRIPPALRPAANTLVASQKRKRLPRDANELRRSLLKNLLNERLRGVFLDLKSAQALHSVVISGTRTDVLCVRTLEQGLPELANIDEWEQQREIKVPWVSDLTSTEVVRLREQAASALPRFREVVASSLAGSDDHVPRSPSAVISELRAQAAEVEAELKALAPRIRKRDRTTVALISTGLALYGFEAAGIPGMAAAGQLATTLGLIHGFARADGAEEAKLKSRPGYVLLKARELLSARSHQGHAG